MGRRALVTRQALAALAALAAALAAIGSAACGGGATYRLERGIDRGELAGAARERWARLVAAGVDEWRGRTDPARLAAALGRWEQAVRIKDDDWVTHARLARGYFFQADSVFAQQASGGAYPYHGGSGVDPGAAERYKQAHRRGAIAALRGMAARSREFEQRLQAGMDIQRAVRLFGKDAAPLIYWYVANLGRWARSSGLRALVGSRGAIVGCLHHLRRIDPAYFYGGADRLLGVYYAAAPGIMGGDLSRSRAHFDAALRAGASYHGNAVLAAEFLDRKARDRKSFEGRLRRVMDGRGRVPPGVEDDLAPENQVELRKARALLQRAASFFAE
jgi:TRAP transporter T-component